MAVVVYSKTGCKYCDLAVLFLDGKNTPFTKVIMDPCDSTYVDMRDRLFEKTGQHTFPQIFVGSTFVGGYSDMIHAYSTGYWKELCVQNGINFEDADY